LADPTTPSLVTNPSDDLGFRAAARDAVEAGAATPAALQSALSGRFPRTVVRARELSGENAVVWYVYREGRWAGGDGDSSEG
jgi:hypothetical protein